MTSTQPETQPHPQLQVREWHRDNFLISTDASLIPLSTLNAAFASDLIYWCSALPESELRLMLDRSVCFALYDTSNASNTSTPALVGFARLITDYVTLAYLTDVYVLEAYQGRGLGVWLMDAVREFVDGMRYMRGLLLIASEGRAEEYYGKKLGTGRLESWAPGHRVFMRKGPGSALN